MKKEKSENNANGDEKIGDLGHRYRVQFDISYKGSPGRIMDASSQTVPDLNLTVRQLLENHTRGKDSKVQVRQPLYFDMVIPQVRDITDVEAFKAMLEEQLERTNKFIEEDKKAGEEKRKKEAEEKEAAHKKELRDEIAAMKNEDNITQ